MKPVVALLLLVLPACTQQACQPAASLPVVERPTALIVPSVAPQAPTSALWPNSPSIQPAVAPAPRASARSVTAKPPAAKPKAKPTPKAKKKKKTKKAAVRVRTKGKVAPVVRARGRGVVQWWCGYAPKWATPGQIVAGAKTRGYTVSRADAQACLASKT